ncbi:MAG TPA: CoA transferase subunit A [Candidatus Dietzia intestinipullorum]|nr:CoA transferase subunit A [Candidatus Dietzia intestinipullorum]
MSSKFMTAAEAVADIPAGASIAAGGFGLSGIPQTVIEALAARDVGDFEVFSNNAGVDGKGLGILLETGKLRRIVASYVGENKEFARQYLSGELEVELTPQGTLAERMRAGGSGIGAFFTRAGVGTLVADGGMPWRYGSDGSVAVASPAKETREIRGETYVLEQAIDADYSLVRAAVADTNGNLRFNLTARNFSPVAAMAGRTCIVEAEQVVEAGELAPDDIHLPGIFVHRLVRLTPDQVADTKWIEKTTTNPPSEGQR